MSSHHNKRKRRQVTETPMLVERLVKETQENNSGAYGFNETWRGRPKTGNYEEDNWPWLSPAFREAHNKRLQARGLPTIPPPKVDLYVKPQAPVIKPFDPADKEFLQATREFFGNTLMGGGDEGATGGKVVIINGKPVKF